METYAVAKWDSEDEELEIKIVKAESILHAYCVAFETETYTQEKAVFDFEDAQNYEDYCKEDGIIITNKRIG